MRAIEITEFGHAEVLKICDRPIPVALKGEVLIKVHAAGVNRPDVLQRMGHYPVPQGASDLPGLEVAGEIVAGNVDGSGFKCGDLVCALVPGGGYAEYVVAPIAHCLPIPDGLSVLEAASLPETFFTVWANVFGLARLVAGESLLVHGGTSGIGVAAIQIATALGHSVFTTVGTEEKREFAERLGAVKAINYRAEEFSAVVKVWTNGRGVDVILDMVAGKYLKQNIDCLADDGRLAVIALLGGPKAELDLLQVLRRRLSIGGSTLRPRSLAFKADIATQLKDKVWPLLVAKKIVPVIQEVFSLEQASGAHKLMESGQHIGKIMLQV
jgi:NADPH2:quinone reductase